MKIMFICTGNICRSAMAEGMMKKLIKENNIDAEVSNVNADDATDNVNSGVADEITSAQEQRQSYLDALAGY